MMMAREAGHLSGPIAVLVLIALAAGPASAQRTVTRRDSARVAIVTATRGQWSLGSGWVIPSVPVATLSSSFLRVSGGFVGVDRAIVANTGNGSIEIFDLNGSRLATFGRLGSGPGEFRGIAWLQCGRRSCWAYDPNQRRLIRFTLTGQHEETFSLAAVRESSMTSDRAWQILGAHAIVADSFAVMRLGQPMTELTTGPVRPLERIQIVRGSTSVDLGSMQGPEVHFLASRGGRVVTTPPFARRSIVRARQDLVYVADSERDEVRVYRPLSPTSVQLIRLVRQPTPITEDAFSEYLRQRFRGVTPTPEAIELQRSLLGHRTTAFFDDMMVSTDGFVWLLDPKTGRTGSRTWQVIQPDGVWLGGVEAPAGVAILHVGSRHVLGLRETGDGEERVELFGLVKRR